MASSHAQADDDLLTVEAMAHLTGRSAQMIRRYIRQGIVQAVQDPTDARRKLIPWEAHEVIMNQLRIDPVTRGFIHLRRAELTMSDGSKRFVTYTPTTGQSRRKEGSERHTSTTS